MEYIYTQSPYPPFGSGVPRTPTARTSIHLTDVIRYIEVDLNTVYKGDWKADQHLTMDVGFLWEYVLEMAYAARRVDDLEKEMTVRMAERIGEIEHEGIIGSPDGIGNDEDIYNDEGDLIWKGTGEIILEEYKATWKSSIKTTAPEVWTYMTQIKSYLKMLDLDVCVMRILYLMGDYRGSGPQYYVGRFKFSQQELNENWTMIQSYADKLRNDDSWWDTRKEAK